MLKRLDIEEGVKFDDLPMFSYGKIKSAPYLQERYITSKVAGRRLFVASGFYGGILNKRTSRVVVFKDA